MFKQNNSTTKKKKKKKNVIIGAAPLPNPFNAHWENVGHNFSRLEAYVSCRWSRLFFVCIVFCSFIAAWSKHYLLMFSNNWIFFLKFFTLHFFLQVQYFCSLVIHRVFTAPRPSVKQRPRRVDRAQRSISCLTHLGILCYTTWYHGCFLPPGLSGPKICEKTFLTSLWMSIWRYGAVEQLEGTEGGGAIKSP